jgi:excisionase family DNA binding protein
MAKLTRKQLAEAENVSIETVINWEERGIIPFIKIGHVIRFDLAKVEKALEKFERTAAAQ